jgi:hypothetical protein
MTTSFRAIYERKTQTLRPLEKIDLPDGELIVSARSATEYKRFDEHGFPIQETLADVLGFDPNDEKKMRELGESQYRAILEMQQEVAESADPEAFSKLPPSDSDLDAILYDELQ